MEDYKQARRRDILNEEKKRKLNVKITTRFGKEIRVTSKVDNETKNAFLQDCIDRHETESFVCKKVLSIYYAVIKQNPSLRNKGFDEIKTILIFALNKVA